MTYALLSLLMVAAADVPAQPPRAPAAEVFECTFEQTWDTDFDEWPDGWTRRQGPGFPHYVKVQIHALSPQSRCLQVELDGGAAAVYSPPIDVAAAFSYVLQGRLKTEGIEHNRAYFSLTLLDEDRQRLETFFSEKVQQTDDWETLRLGPVVSRNGKARFAAIGLHVQPQSREDLAGRVLFDDLRLARLPRIELKTNHPHNFFTAGEPLEVVCTASGVQEEELEVGFRLEDVLGRELARHEGRLAVESQPGDARRGRVRWAPPIPGPGFYRVQASLQGRTAAAYQRRLNLVVIEPQATPHSGEFAWAVAKADHPMPLAVLGQLVTQVGVSRVKYPLWYDDQEQPEFVKELIAFSEQLDAHGIELVGLLGDPPASLRDRFGRSTTLRAAQLFTADPDAWYPSLESVMARMATRVRWWQLGTDTDTSFVDYPNLVEQIAQIKAELDRVGQGVRLGIGWDWMHALPPASRGDVSWQYVNLSSDPPLTHRELAAYLDASSGAGVGRWVVVEPLPADDYPLPLRAEDLVRRMIAAKIHGAETVCCPRVFGASRGLMADDGTPGELLLPWRTTALSLAGATYLGSIQLPGGSPNHVFARQGEAIMVAWNDRPTQEVLYLGENVRQTDLWGRSVEPPRREHRHVIAVGPLPVFVTGLSEPVARWRMDFDFHQRQFPSVFGRPHANGLEFTNHFPGGAGGQVTLATPGVWRVEPQRFGFRLAEGERQQRPFDVTFPYEASSGRHPLRADFEVQADRLYRFSVYRQLQVGLGDVYVEIATRLNDRGELEVQQRLINESDRSVSFRCQLFIPQRRRLKTQIIDLAGGHDEKTYRLADGQNLLGQTLWLRAQELDGPRILNYRFVATQ